jgi:hypothetical protein
MRPMIVLLVAGVGAFAQPHPGPTFGTFGSSLPSPSQIGLPPGRIVAPPLAAHPHHSRTAIVPVPVYYGGYYVGYDAPPPAYGTAYDTPPSGYASNGAPGYADPSQSPMVIINQNYRPDLPAPPPPDSTVRKYETPTHPYDDQPAAPDAPPTIYLVAMKDHTIFPALAYWVEGDTLNYITTEGSHNRATLDLVDREFSRRINEERNVEFKLPPPKQ